MVSLFRPIWVQLYVTDVGQAKHQRPIQNDRDLNPDKASVPLLIPLWAFFPPFLYCYLATWWEGWWTLWKTMIGIYIPLQWPVWINFQVNGTCEWNMCSSFIACTYIENRGLISRELSAVKCLWFIYYFYTPPYRTHKVAQGVLNTAYINTIIQNLKI